MKYTLFILFLVLGNACAFADSSPIQIGVILPLSGAAHLAGAQAQAGIEKASIPGVQLVFEDDVCSAMNGLSIYQKLSSMKNVKFFLGPCCSSPMKVVAPLLAKNNQIGMGVCGLSESVLESAKGHLFSPIYTIEAEDAFLAEKMFGMGMRKVAIVFWDNDFSRAHETGFRKAFKGDVFSYPFVNFEVQSIRDIIVQLKSKKIDAIYIPLVEPLNLGFMKEMKNLGLENVKVFSIYGAQMKDVIEANGSAADGLIYSHPKIPLGEDALFYFSRLGAEILGNTVFKCRGEYDCVINSIKESGQFDEHGSLRHEIELRTIQDGKFVKMLEIAYNNFGDGDARVQAPSHPSH
jgi:branched-chain amino acid transport system substrate-binding protein